MTAINRPAARSAAPAPFPLPRWTWAALLAAVAVLWLVTMEGSVVSQAVGGTSNFLHELFHDGRHLLGVPCH